MFRDELSSKSLLPCGYDCNSFIEVINHLQTEHGMKLVNNRDFCQSDEIIFRTPVTAVEHFLTHGINALQLGLSWNSKEQTCDSWFQKTLDKLSGIRKDILDHIFNPEIGEEDASVEESQVFDSN